LRRGEVDETTDGVPEAGDSSLGGEKALSIGLKSGLEGGR
jgi:hypothetical protein